MGETPRGGRVVSETPRRNDYLVGGGSDVEMRAGRKGKRSGKGGIGWFLEPAASIDWGGLRRRDIIAGTRTHLRLSFHWSSCIRRVSRFHISDREGSHRTKANLSAEPKPCGLQTAQPFPGCNVSPAVGIREICSPKASIAMIDIDMRVKKSGGEKEIQTYLASTPESFGFPPPGSFARWKPSIDPLPLPLLSLPATSQWFPSPKWQPPVA